MAPQDQQVAVTCFGWVSTSRPELSGCCVVAMFADSAALKAASTSVVPADSRSYRKPTEPSALGSSISPCGLLGWPSHRPILAGSGIRIPPGRQNAAGHGSIYEKELPQPHDFFAFGFRNSKP